MSIEISFWLQLSSQKNDNSSILIIMWLLFLVRYMENVTDATLPFSL